MSYMAHVVLESLLNSASSDLRGNPDGNAYPDHQPVPTSTKSSCRRTGVLDYADDRQRRIEAVYAEAGRRACLSKSGQAIYAHGGGIFYQL